MKINTRQFGKLLWFLQTILIIYFLYNTYIFGSGIHFYIAFTLIIIRLFFTPAIDHVYLYVSISPFIEYITINSRNVVFILFTITLLKLIRTNSVKIEKTIFLTFVLVVNIINSVLDLGLAEIILSSFNLAFFIVLLNTSIFRKFEKSRVIESVLVATSSAIFFTVVNEGVKSISDVANSEYVFDRFGEFTRGLSGAMELPMYSVLFIALTLLLISRSSLSKNKVVKMSGIISCLLVFYLSILTISRVVIVGYTVMICCYIFINSRWKFSRLRLFILIFGSYIIVSVFGYTPIFIDQIRKISARMETANSNIRLQIWQDSFRYLMGNLKALLFGEGVYHYVIVGRKLGLKFQMMAHNIFLDSLLSFGVIGTSFIIVNLCNFTKRIINSSKFSLDSFSVCPILIWLTINMFEGSFYYTKTYLLLFALTYIAFASEKEQYS